MNKKLMEALVPVVMAKVEGNQASLMIDSDGKINKVVKGKAAAFGATVISMGLKPTVMLYSDTSGDAKGRLPVIQTIFAVLKALDDDRYSALRYWKKAGDTRDLLAYVRNLNGPELRAARDIIQDIGVLLKLALRTYPEREDKA